MEVKIKTANGETKQLRITHYTGKIVDPLWCDACNCATWQESIDGVYVCDHKPTSKAPYERKKDKYHV